MARTRIEYGIQDSEDERVIMLTDDEGREDAIKGARYYTEKTGRMFLAVERTHSVTDWKPTNTGVVPPDLDRGDPRNGR